METYLQTAWGDQWDDVTIDIIKTVIEGIKRMDDEHGAFWVIVVNDDENVLEVHNDLELFGVFEDEPGIQYKGRGKDWNDIEALFQTFLANNIEIVKTQLKRES